VRSRFLPKPSSRPSAFAVRLALIAGAGLAIRVVFALTVAGDGNLHAPGGDRFFFVEGAKLLANGHGFIDPLVRALVHVDAPSAAHPPLWMLLLTPFAKAGALTYTSARAIGAVVGAVVVGGARGGSRRRPGGRPGGIAAGIAAVYPAWVVADTSGMSEVLYVLFVGLALLAVLDRRAWLAGIAVGLAALTRTEGLLLVPLLLWPAFWGRGALVATALAVVAIARWTIDRSVELHRFVPVSTNDASVIAGANCGPAYHGRDTGSWVPACLDVGRLTTDEGELAGRWESAGRHYATHHLGRLPAVAAVRVLRTWRMWQPLRNTSEGENGTAVKVGALWFLILLLPAGLLGMWRRRSWPLVALCLAPTITSAIGWGTPRFLRPAELALMLAASAYVATRGSSSGARPSRPT
jgi:hypothetical protein